MPLHRLVAPLAAALLLGMPQLAPAATLTVDIPGCSQVDAVRFRDQLYAQLRPSRDDLRRASHSGQPQRRDHDNAECRVLAGSHRGHMVRIARLYDALGRRRRAGDGFRDPRRSKLRLHGARDGGPALRLRLGRRHLAGRQHVDAAVGMLDRAHPDERGARDRRRCDLDVSESCSGGGAVTSYSWRKNAASSWSSSQAPTDSLPANTGSALVTHTYGLTACSNGACAAEVITTFTVAGSAPVGFCSQFNDVSFVDLNWGNPPVDTTGGVGLAPGAMIVGRLTVPGGASSPSNLPGTISIVEHGGPTAERVMTLSTQPCDFRGWTPGQNFPAGDQSGSSGPMGWGGGINPNKQYLLAGDPAGFPAKPLLSPGVTYYVNMQTINFSNGLNSCQNASCDVRITVNTPN